jgi:hypothetical protein
MKKVALAKAGAIFLWVGKKCAKEGKRAKEGHTVKAKVAKMVKAGEGGGKRTFTKESAPEVTQTGIVSFT